MNFLNELDVTPILNGVGPATRLGGLNVDRDIIDEALDCSQASFRMDELHVAASNYLEKTLPVPGGLVTCGAAAALTIATAVVLAGNDSDRMSRLPKVNWKKNKVLVQAGHHDPYDHAIIAAGADLMIVGDQDGCSITEIKLRINDEVCAIVFRCNESTNQVSFEEIAQLCSEKKISLIVDAAIYVPPITRLKDFFDKGARFVATSGGKGFRGPHTAGLLFCNKQDVILSLLQHLDMDERENTWKFLQNQSEFPITLPTNGIARSMKVGKEQIFQMLLAIRNYTKRTKFAEGYLELKIIEDSLLKEEIKCVRYFNDFLFVDTLKFFIGNADEVDQFYNLLAKDQPRVILGQELTNEGFLTINPMALNAGEGIEIAGKIIEIMRNQLKKARD